MKNVQHVNFKGDELTLISSFLPEQEPSLDLLYSSIEKVMDVLNMK